MPPLLTVVGRKNAGKTTLVVLLAAELRKRGLRVMTIKHGSHTFNIDPETTDTYRHFHEGEAERVAMVSPDKFALIIRSTEELAPEQIAEQYMVDADLVLCEGFKKSSLHRIEIFRKAAHARPLFDPEAPNAGLYRVIVTDDDDFTAPIPVVYLSDAAWMNQLVSLLGVARA